MPRSCVSFGYAQDISQTKHSDEQEQTRKNQSTLEVGKTQDAARQILGLHGMAGLMRACGDTGGG
jgi:hypothetical protein